VVVLLVELVAEVEADVLLVAPPCPPAPAPVEEVVAPLLVVALVVLPPLPVLPLVVPPVAVPSGPRSQAKRREGAASAPRNHAARGRENSEEAMQRGWYLSPRRTA
jgi:hypothetical protein